MSFQEYMLVSRKIVVGWVERSVTQHRLESMLSFTPLTHNLQTKYPHYEIAKQRLVVKLLQYHFLLSRFLDVFQISKPSSFAVLLQFLYVLVRAVL